MSPFQLQCQLMNTHHLTLGILTDFLSGRKIVDTHDERYRQKIARLLVMDKQFDKQDITAASKLTVKTPDKAAIIPVDFIVHIGGKALMLIKYGPGSITTRHRPALSVSRLVAPHQIPVVVVTNGEDADILWGKTGTIMSSGLARIPDKQELCRMVETEPLEMISERRVELESRILYAFDVDGRCPCDSDICRIEE